MLTLISGLADCVLALGFEKMERGSLGAKVCLGYNVQILANSTCH